LGKFRTDRRRNADIGRAGARSLSPTVILTIHIPDDAPQQAVDQTLEAIIAAHLWKCP
jgi:hypothetical protein